MKLVFQPSIFRGYVCLRECMYDYCRSAPCKSIVGGWGWWFTILGSHYAGDQLTFDGSCEFYGYHVHLSWTNLEGASQSSARRFDTFHWDLFRATTQCQDVSGRRIGWATECFFLVVFTCIEASRWDVLCWVCFVFCILLASQWRRRDSAE